MQTSQRLHPPGQPHPKLRNIADRVTRITEMAIERVVANHQDPQRYLLPAGAGSLEGAMKRLFDKLPSSDRRGIIEKANARIKAANQERARVYGDLAQVNLRAQASIIEQVKSLPVPAHLRATREELEELAAMFIKPKVISRRAAPRGAAPATELEFNVNSLACIKNSEFRRDEINLFGIAVDNLGVAVESTPFFVGKFKKGERINVNPPNGRFSFKLTEGAFPKSFAVSLLIIEKDFFGSLDDIKPLLNVVLGLYTTAAIVTLGAMAAGSPLAIPVVVIGSASLILLQVFGGYFLPRLVDDVSFPGADTLTLETPVNAGAAFERRIAISGGIGFRDVFDGSYEAAVTWALKG